MLGLKYEQVFALFEQLVLMRWIASKSPIFVSVIIDHTGSISEKATDFHYIANFVLFCCENFVKVLITQNVTKTASLIYNISGSMLVALSKTYQHVGY